MPTNDSSTSDLNLAELDRLERVATVGEWYAELVTMTDTELEATIVTARHDSHWRSGGRTVATVGHWRDRVAPESDAALIIASRNQLRPLLDLVNRMEKALVCSTAGPGACGHCNPCLVLAEYQRAKGEEKQESDYCGGTKMTGEGYQK